MQLKWLINNRGLSDREPFQKLSLSVALAMLATQFLNLDRELWKLMHSFSISWPLNVGPIIHTWGSLTKKDEWVPPGANPEKDRGILVQTNISLWGNQVQLRCSSSLQRAILEISLLDSVSSFSLSEGEEISSLQLQISTSVRYSKISWWMSLYMVGVISSPWDNFSLPLIFIFRTVILWNNWSQESHFLEKSIAENRGGE